MRRRECRRAARLRIAVPVRFEDGVEAPSRDISSVGIFVDTDHLQPQGRRVRLSVMLAEWDPEGGFRVHGEGRVVRAGPAGEGRGIALDVVWSDVEPLGSRHWTSQQ